MSTQRTTQQVRRDGGPLTERGTARREALLHAARRVFESKGFIDTRVSDIVKEAKVSHGTFYTYFDTKDEVFEAVANDVASSMLTESAVTEVPNPDFQGRVRESLRRYIDSYRHNAAILALMDQVGTSSPAMRRMRLDVREHHLARTQRGITRMQALGLADKSLDVEYTAEALGAMMEHICHLWFSLGHDFDTERLLEALTHVWERTLASPVLPGPDL
ncbi:TetR/AcrR family transcriptional regulator [Rhodococcoides fascians]|uniref:TetR/AcrR family transcriptional regulator n=1 Tax=Rhodococcoides fascians TaxID=1828 RepID=UPI002ACDA975|nr:TetR/AcrR family transcriptional regulator [Rhodococcus fascians]WQH28797.1 TetR/AcrR family transcriptional regulator [Rhodococcus fascians]